MLQAEMMEMQKNEVTVNDFISFFISSSTNHGLCSIIKDLILKRKRQK